MKDVNDNIDDTFISKMIEETYSFLPEYDTSKGASDLFSYFDMRDEKRNENKSVVDFLREKSIIFFEIRYLKEIKCFRIIHAGTPIDFPCNWSVFSNVYKSASDNQDKLAWIDLSANDCPLRDVLCSLVDYKSDPVFLTKSNKAYLIFQPIHFKNLRDELIDNFSRPTEMRKAA